jgi:Uma2 family endonuclease
MSTKPIPLLKIEYAEAAEAYLRSLPPEHFMEAVGQSTQRKITLESLDLVTARRPDVHVFNELLVQYRVGRARKLRQVVPDNMVVLWEGRIKAEGSYAVEVQPAGPYWMLEYVSRTNKRKDYEDSFVKYERELKVPYYLLFYPDDQELTLYRHNKRKYVSVKPDSHGRYAVGALEVELALVDGWVRYWFRGELLPLPAELQRERDELRRRTERLAAQLGALGVEPEG